MVSGAQILVTAGKCEDVSKQFNSLNAWPLPLPWPPSGAGAGADADADAGVDDDVDAPALALLLSGWIKTTAKELQ